MNKYIKVTQNACIFMVNDTADVDNWKGKTIQLYVWEVPEQLLNKLKSKWLVEMAAKNLSAIWWFWVFNEAHFSFFTKLNFSNVILLYHANCRLILPKLTEGLLGWAPNRVWRQQWSNIVNQIWRKSGDPRC